SVRSSKRKLRSASTVVRRGTGASSVCSGSSGTSTSSYPVTTQSGVGGRTSPTSGSDSSGGRSGGAPSSFVRSSRASSVGASTQKSSTSKRRAHTRNRTEPGERLASSNAPRSSV